MIQAVQRFFLIGVAAVSLTACGVQFENTRPADEILDDQLFEGRRKPPSRLSDVLFRRADPAKIGNINKYLWNSSLEVLSFLPVQSVDPYTGVIVTGFGTPPGGGRAYRATVLISDPALEARSLSLSMQTRNGPVSAATLRAVEDAIMTRARQLRERDSRF